MIRAFNGEVVSSIATDQQLLPLEVTEDGLEVVAGRNKFNIKWVSGTFQVSKGIPIGSAVSDRTPTFLTLSAAGECNITASPTDIAEDQLGSNRNIHVKGVGTFILTW